MVFQKSGYYVCFSINDFTSSGNEKSWNFHIFEAESCQYMLSLITS